MNDAELLRRFSKEGSEEAFAELVRQRIGLVYTVALRQTRGDAHRAEDVVQIVFSDLARQASRLCRRPVLAGWLYRAAQYTAIDLIRAEQRRLIRERHVQSGLSLTMNEEPESDWTIVRPVLDQTMNELTERDRNAVLLRFFDGRSFAEIGARLQLTENAARMRVDRALDKLHALLARHGVTSARAALGAALTTQAAGAAPAGLAASVTTTALAATGAVGGGAAVIGLMSSIKVQVGIAAVLVAAGTTGIVSQSRSNQTLRDEVVQLRQQIVAAEALRIEEVQAASEASEGARLRRRDADLAQLQEQVQAVEALQHQASRAAAARNAAPARERVYGLHDLQQPPKLSRQSRPVYPPEFRKVGIEGEATIAVIIRPNGDVSDAETIEATHPAFAAAAMEALQQWQFEPGLKDGLPVPVRMQIPVRFTVNRQLPLEEALKNWF